MSHTPAPWSIDFPNGKLKAFDGEFTIGDAMGFSRENAEHIIKCVNSHDELLEAAKEVSRYFNETRFDVYGETSESYTKSYERLEVAIQKAEKSQGEP